MPPVDTSHKCGMELAPWALSCRDVRAPQCTASHSTAAPSFGKQNRQESLASTQIYLNTQVRRGQPTTSLTTLGESPFPPSGAQLTLAKVEPFPSVWIVMVCVLRWRI